MTRSSTTPSARRRQPYYVLTDALHELRRQMTGELWTTSVFCPQPITAQNRREYNCHADRFALAYRARTAQRQRRLQFEECVRQGLEQRQSVKEIAAAAVKTGLCLALRHPAFHPPSRLRDDS